MIIHPKIANAVLLIALLTVSGRAASLSASQPGASSTPPDLYCDFVPVSPEDNAILDWRRADAQRVPLNSHETDVIRFCWRPGAHEPSDSDLADLRNWLLRNQAALDAFDASLKKSKAQWPERDPSAHQPELLTFAQLIKGRLFQADQLAEQGKFEDVARLLENNLKLAQEGVDGDPQLLHYIVAATARTFTQDAILRFASRKAVPVSILEALLTNLPSLNQETNAYDRILRLEFAQEMSQRADAKTYARTLADAWTKPVATNLLAFYPPECWRPVRVLLDPTLVSFHPKPIDFDVEIALSARHYRNYRTNAFSKWADRVEVAELDRQQIQSNLLVEIQPLMDIVKNEPLPLSHRAAQNAKDAYVQIANPVGRIADCSFMTIAWDDSKVFRVRTEREATRTVLALIIFERHKGVLPAKLSDLVDANILKPFPLDFFADAPLHYSRERHILWSAGIDGTDNNGTPGDTRWGGDDAVWQIPELN